MRLLHQEFNFVFDFEENVRSLLVVEHPEIFCKMVRELSSDDRMEESGFVLSENEVPVKMKDQLLCIVNPLSISLNERKLLGKLLEVLKKEVCSSELLLECNQVIVSLENYALHVMQNADWELACADKIEIPELLKFLKIQFNDRQNSLIEKILDYVRAVYDLLGINCFVFVHLLSYLTEYEVEKLYEYVQYYKIHILLMESRLPDTAKKFKETVIIDKDTCEIQINM